MNITFITSTWTGILQQFFPIFTTPTTKIFYNLAIGWVLCTGRKTVTRILPLADPQNTCAHDAYHRFFPDAAWTTGQLWKHLAVLLVKVFYPQGVIPLDLDDTVFHRTGKKVDGAGWWRDAVRSTATTIVYAWGLNLVVVTLRVNPPWKGSPIGLPISIRLHRKGGPTLVQLAEQMLTEITEWFNTRHFQVCCDGFYAHLAGCNIPRTHIVSRMRQDANIYELPPKRRQTKRGRPAKKGKKLAAPQKMAGYASRWKKVKTCQRGKTKTRLIYSRIVLWYKVSIDPVLLVLSRDPARTEKDNFFFTTDITMKGEDVLTAYSGRWSVEQTIKETKQVIGGHQLQTWKRFGPERAATMAFWLHSTIWLWFLGQKKLHSRQLKVPWYTAKSHPSFTDAACCLRRQLWQERIKIMFEKSTVHDKNTRLLIEALASAA
jgi:hypothetical protein